MRQVVVHTLKSKKEFLDWSEELRARKDEVLESLKREHVHAESAHIFSSKEGVDYLIFVLDSSDKPVPADIAMEVNKKHKAMLARLVTDRVNAEEAYHFEI